MMTKRPIYLASLGLVLMAALLVACDGGQGTRVTASPSAGQTAASLSTPGGPPEDARGSPVLGESDATTTAVAMQAGRCPLPSSALLHPPAPEVPYPSPPAELAPGLIVFRVTDFDISKPLADSRIGLRFISWSPSGAYIVTDWATRSADVDGLAVFDARDMLEAPGFQDWIDQLEKCEGPMGVGVDVEVQVNGFLLQFQTAMDLQYGALFWVIGSGRPSETGPYVPLPTVDVSRSWLYPVASDCAVPPSSWEAAMEASLWQFRPPDCSSEP